MKKALYNLGIRSYRLLVKIAALRNPKARKLAEGQKSIFPYLEKEVTKEGEYIWIHASSLGEFEQGRPLIEELKKQYPDKKIALTFFSPSGYEVRKNYPLADLVCYLPFDLPHNVCRFLDLLRPSIAIFIKYEFWGNYLRELRRRQIPTYIISAIFRPDQIFFRPYGGLFRRMLRTYAHLYVQNETSRELLAGIGIHNVSVVGDTRFDRVVDIRRQAKKLPIAEAFSAGRQVLIAGSSWPKDEDIFIDYFNRHPELRLIIAPHEIHESHITEILGKLKRPAVRYTQTNEAEAATADCLIVDCFGLLSSIYQYGQMAYIGGGFGVGIHNVPEAAVYGIPVVFGPNYRKFQEAKDLIADQGAFSISTPDEFEKLMQHFENGEEYRRQCGENAATYIYTHTGATKTILAGIAQKLSAHAE